MKRNVALALSVAILVLTAEARELTMIEGAQELALADVTLPQGIRGSVEFRRCDSCAATRLAVDAETVFELSGARLSLAQFLASVAALRQAEGANALVTVHHALSSGRVTRISVWAPAGVDVSAPRAPAGTGAER